MLYPDRTSVRLLFFNPMRSGGGDRSGRAVPYFMTGDALYHLVIVK